MKHETRRIVTGHDENGKSVIQSDGIVAHVDDYGVAMVNRIWSTDVFPSDNTDTRDGSDLISTLTSPNGTGFYYVDWAPGAVFPLHRTMSLDYLIVLSGELELSFEDGTATTIRSGDTVIQRGAEHIWKNPTDEWTRTAIIMIGAKPHIVGGEPVEATLG